MNARLLAYVSIAVLAHALPAAAAPKKTLHLVPAKDATLAALLLTAHGTREPVLLFDPQDADEIRDGAALVASPRRCYVDAGHAGTTTASLLGDIAGAACEIVNAPHDLAQRLWSNPQVVVAFADGDEAARVRAAGLAAAVSGALLPVAAGEKVSTESLGAWKPTTLLLAGVAAADGLGIAHVAPIDTPEAIFAEFQRLHGGPPSTLILTNPADRTGMFSPSGLSEVSPVYAALHRAPVFPVPSAESEAIEAFARKLMQVSAFQPAHILLIGDELALRSHRIPDPVLESGGPEARGGGTIVRVELFSEIQLDRPQIFPVGRVIAENAGFASISLLRRLHVANKAADRPVIFLTNADQVFALGETISRSTVNDLTNLGIRVRAYFRDEITPEVSQRALGQTDVLVWEGHPRDLTLEERGGVAIDAAPQIAILQGCYTLDRNDPYILIEKGTQAIVATSAAIYSASGSAFARALFDAIAYGGADLGTAVRDARNYLLAVTRMKRERGHKDWRKTLRAAMAFALWGDPCLRAPIKPGKPDAKPASWTLDDAGLGLDIPRRQLREVRVGQYRAQQAPRAMLGGLLEIEKKNVLRLKDFYYGVFRVPPERSVVCPPNPNWNVVSLYSPATQTLSVLARPDWLVMTDAKESGSYRFTMAASPEQCGAAPTPTP